MPPVPRSGAAWISSVEPTIQDLLLESIDDATAVALPWLFDFWALDHQRPPPGDWHAWVILGGRGAGKTRAGAEWVRAMVEGAGPRDPGRARRVALVGETIDQAREVMVMGDSGILACCPPDRRPEWIATRRLLVWPNGATAQLFSAHDPDSLRGPQFDAAWADELAKWPRAGECWDMLQFTLRLGPAPQVCVTTTPRDCPTLRDLLDRPSTVTTHAPTEANRAHLAPGFLSEVRARYGHGRLARQELDGLFLDEVEGTLWPAGLLESCRTDTAPVPDRIVVAVDPAVAGQGTGDSVGIVVAGVIARGPPQDWRAVVLEDATVSGLGSDGWMRHVVETCHRHGADRVVAEVNQGGALVESLLRTVDATLPYRAVHATRGKSARAEPVAALYEQGRVAHLGGFSELEDQMGRMTSTGYRGSGSPDRVDALVWALTELMLVPARRAPATPQMRPL